MLNRRDFSTAAGLVLGSFVLPKGVTAQADLRTAKVVVDASATIGDLPAFGLGFSMEKHLIGVGDQFTEQNTGLAGCCRRLAPQIFRLGGNHVDTTQWDANGPGGVNGQTSPQDINRFADFVKSVAIAANRIDAVPPGFYGLAFLSDLGTGTIVRTRATGMSPRQSAFAIRHADGKVPTVLNNMTNNTLSVQVLLEGAKPDARMCLLTAPALLADSGVTLGGATIAVNGAGKSSCTSITGQSVGTFNLSVPPASAVRVTTL